MFSFEDSSEIETVSSASEFLRNSLNICDNDRALVYVGVLISFWLFLFLIRSTTERISLGWVKEVRTTKP
jgi:hypothetical protein